MAKQKQYAIISNQEIFEEIFTSIKEAQGWIDSSYDDADDGIQLMIYELVPVVKGEVVQSTKVIWNKV